MTRGFNYRTMLRAIERRRKWREHRDVRLIEVWEDADPGQGVLAARHCRGAFGTDGGNLALNETVRESCGGSARRLDLLKKLPGCAAKLVRQILNSAGTGGRIVKEDVLSQVNGQSADGRRGEAGGRRARRATSCRPRSRTASTRACRQALAA